jgi:hypothetical protein
LIYYRELLILIGREHGILGHHSAVSLARFQRRLRFGAHLRDSGSRAAASSAQFHRVPKARQVANESYRGDWHPTDGRCSVRNETIFTQLRLSRYLSNPL